VKVKRFEAGKIPEPRRPQKRHGLHRFHGFVKKFSIQYWGSPLDAMGAGMLYTAVAETILENQRLKKSLGL
jgi:hypothetical protein